MLSKILFILFLIIEFSQARDTLSDNKIQARLNIVNGSSSECVMEKFYTNSGWTKINGQIGRGGIDGLFYKTKSNTIKEVLISESKWNTSQLGRSGKNKAIKQMSQEWILRSIDKLIKKYPEMPYTTIRKFIAHNQYRARIFRLKPLQNNHIQISIYRVKNKGKSAFDKFIDTQLKPIDINRPRNSFEQGIIEAFNSCRSQYLHKYFTMLRDDEVKKLLKDNYIQKKDIKSIL